MRGDWVLKKASWFGDESYLKRVDGCAGGVCRVMVYNKHDASGFTRKEAKALGTDLGLVPEIRRKVSV